MKNKITFLMVLLFSSVAFASQLENSAMKKSLRPMSMGGTFVAITDDDNAFFYNPAEITYRNSFLIQLFSLDIATNATAIDSYNFFSDNKATTKINKLIDKILKQALNFYHDIFVSIPNILFVTSPIAVKENYLNFGLGVFSYATANANVNRDVIVPSVSYDIEVTGPGIFSIAFKINSLEKIRMPGALSLGANLNMCIESKMLKMMFCC